MTDYIERDAVAAAVIAKKWAIGSGDGEMAMQIVLSAPAADVAPVVHGRWESHLMPLAYKCSVCGYRPSAKEWKFHKRNYCPNCGAKMDGEENK